MDSMVFCYDFRKIRHKIRPTKTTPSIHPHHFRIISITSIPPPYYISTCSSGAIRTFGASRFRSNGRQPVFGAAVSGLGRPWVRAPARVSAWQCKTPPMRCYKKWLPMAPTPMNLNDVLITYGFIYPIGSMYLWYIYQHLYSWFFVVNVGKYHIAWILLWDMYIYIYIFRHWDPLTKDASNPGGFPLASWKKDRSQGTHPGRFNGWNLQPSPIFQRKIIDSPNLQGIMFHVNLPGCIGDEIPTKLYRGYKDKHIITYYKDPYSILSVCF